MRAHGGTLRRGRFSEAGRPYLVTTVTHQRQPLFADWTIGRTVVRALQQTANDGRAQTLAFVVMPDHLHWLLEVSGTQDLSRLVGWVKGYTARQIGLQRPIPTVWQAGFHDHAVRAEEDLHNLARYVVANPLRAGLVQRLGDYPLWDAIYL